MLSKNELKTRILKDNSHIDHKPKNRKLCLINSTILEMILDRDALLPWILVCGTKERF